MNKNYQFVYSRSHDEMRAKGTNIYVTQEGIHEWSAIRRPWNWTEQRHYSSTPSGAVNKLLRAEEKEGWR